MPQWEQTTRGEQLIGADPGKLTAQIIQEISAFFLAHHYQAVLAQGP
ncbi:MAG: hypothetical protein ABSA09_01400 [Desulfobaccales bacterium]|jgi:hypothetical protein